MTDKDHWSDPTIDASGGEGLARFRSREGKTQQIHNLRDEEARQEKRKLINPESRLRTVSEWLSAFDNSLSQSPEQDSHFDELMRDFLEEKHGVQDVNEVLPARRDTEMGLSFVKGLKNEFLNWMTTSNPWKIQEMLDTAREVMFDEKQLKSGSLLKRYLSEIPNVGSVSSLRQKIESKGASENDAAHDFLMWLSGEGKFGKETLRNMARVASVERKKSQSGVAEQGTSVSETPQDRIFLITLNEKQVENYLEPWEKANLMKFIKFWGSGKVARVGLGVRRGELASVGLAVNENGKEEKVFVSTTVLRRVFNGVGPYRDHQLSDPTGLLFDASDGSTAYIRPKTKPEVAKRILASLTLEGRKLNKGFDVVVAPVSTN